MEEGHPSVGRRRREVLIPAPIETEGEVNVTGDAAAGTVTLSFNLSGLEQGKFELSMDYESAERLAITVSLMVEQVKRARTELAEKAKRNSLLN